MKKLKDTELNTVNGGDYGDVDKEFSSTPEGVKFLYNVGDHVEVYVSFLECSTKGGTIVERKTTVRQSGCSTGYAGYYKIQYDDGGDAWKIANEIES